MSNLTLFRDAPMYRQTRYWNLWFLKKKFFYSNKHIYQQYALFRLNKKPIKDSEIGFDANMGIIL